MGGRLGFAARIGHAFSDERLLERALTHRSATTAHNERLEFLGDAALNFIIAELLFRRFPEAREGSLTRLRAALVRRQTLAEVARELGLGDVLALGVGELKSGGRERESILANAVEAVIGAIYLDAGLDTCRERVETMFASRLERLRAREEARKDAKTRLQEFAQARRLPLPEYTVLHVEGSAHEHSFTVECRVAGVGEATIGRGSSRRGAEQDAARKALERIDHAS